MDDLPSPVSRRDFLAGLGMGFGYSVLVDASDFASAHAAEATPEQIRESFKLIAPPSPDGKPVAGFGGLEHEPNMTVVDLKCDLFVAGGGPAGVCAALAAARHGSKVILVQDRSRLGGNSSSEVKMHIVGANNHTGRPGWREGGIIEELRLDDAANNPHRSWEMWDLLLYDKIVSEPNITLLLDTSVYRATKDATGEIAQVLARSDKTEHIYRITSKLYADCTGDSKLAIEAGATIRWGHEARSEFDEPLGWEKPTRETLGSSILFTARDYGKPIGYTAPKWARKIEKKHLQFRPVGSWEYGYWWIEWGGAIDTIRDNERIRFELLAIVTGVWDYIKNSGQVKGAENWGLDWVGMVPGKRESRRIEGDHILTQQDVMGLNGDFDDAVAIGGWGLDEHPPGGFDSPELRPFTSIKLPEVYNIPFRSLYSKDVPNLLMAGRNASCSHVAFTSTRVMATCAVMGQGMGTAAALCLKKGVKPREFAASKNNLNELTQTLLRDDQTIKHRKNEDSLDVARNAKATSSECYQDSKAENALNGFVRNMSGELTNRWLGVMSTDGAWLELTWDKPQSISHVQLTFDTGFQRELTLTSADNHNKPMIRAPQPETIRDYELIGTTPDGKSVTLATIKSNHQRLLRHDFPKTKLTTLRLKIHATNGSEQARVYEVRCYDEQPM